MPVEIMSGNQAAAQAAQRARVKLVVGYPITPQTTIIETLAAMWSRGELEGDFVNVESEHSALSYCMGAAAVGVRTFTATSSHGLAYMHEIIHWAGGGRFPMVMVNVNRALGSPWCLEPDQMDSLSQRDTGWIQLYCAGAQEIFDAVLQAYVLAESMRIPVMVVYDGFYISHTYEAVDIAGQEAVDRFLDSSSPAAQLVPGRAANLHGIVAVPEEARLMREKHRAMGQVPERYNEINDRFAAIFGRRYSPLEATALGGVETVVIAAGGCSETVKYLLPAYHERGIKVGLIHLKMLRPFPVSDLRGMLAGRRVKRILVVDRNCSPGLGGVLAQEVRAALYGMPEAPVVEDLILAGGVDLTPEMLERALLEPLSGASGFERWGVEM